MDLKKEEQDIITSGKLWRCIENHTIQRSQKKKSD